MKVRTLPPQRRKLFDISAWKDPAYCLLVLGVFIAFIGTWTPFFYIGLYAWDLGVTSEQTAFYLLAVVTAGSVIGRLGPSLLASKIGMYNVVVPCTLVTGCLAFALIGSKSMASIIVVGVLYGIFSGALVSISPAIAMQLSPNRAVVGNRTGMAFSAVSAAMLIGPPVAGNLLDNHGFSAAFAFAGAAGVVGALILALSRVCHGGWTIMKKI